jgi:hypothetical protein
MRQRKVDQGFTALKVSAVFQNQVIEPGFCIRTWPVARCWQSIQKKQKQKTPPNGRGV